MANGRQTVPSFPPPPLKFRTVGFPQYGFKPAFSRALRHPSAALTRPQRRSPPCAFDSVVGLAPKRHSRTLTPLTGPVALGSASGYSVRQPPGLLWPHPSFCLSPSVYELYRWLHKPAEGPQFTLSELDSVPLSLLRWLQTAHRRVRDPGLAFAPWCRARQPYLSTLREPCGRLTKRQHSLNAAARNLASPASDGTFTAELAFDRSLCPTSAITT